MTWLMYGLIYFVGFFIMLGIEAKTLGVKKLKIHIGNCIWWPITILVIIGIKIGSLLMEKKK